jgi:WD40 repeat protein
MPGTSATLPLRRGVAWGAGLALCGALTSGLLPPRFAQNAWAMSSPPPPSFHVAALSTDGTLNATSADEVVQIWRTRDGALLQTLRIKRPVASLAFSPDGRLLATGVPKNLENAVKLWRVSDGKCVRTYRDTDGIGFHGLAFSADGRRLIVYDSGRGKRLRVPPIRAE